MPEREPRGIRIRDQEGEKPEGTYTIGAWCTNCEWEGEVEIPRGTAVPWEASLERLARCETCGCETLQRYSQSDEEEEPADTTSPEQDRDVLDGLDFREELTRMLGEDRHQRPAPPPIPIPTSPAPSTSPFPFSDLPRRPHVGDSPYRPPVAGDSPWADNRFRAWMEAKRSLLDNEGKKAWDVTTRNGPIVMTPLQLDVANCVTEGDEI